MSWTPCSTPRELKEQVIAERAQTLGLVYRDAEDQQQILTPDPSRGCLREGNPFATPAFNRETGEEVFLSVDRVQAHLGALFGLLQGECQTHKRTRLTETALRTALISQLEIEQR